jgi:EpsI family protein
MPDPKLTRRAVIAAVAMAAASATGAMMVPTKRMSVLRGPFQLADLVPTSFGEWRVDGNVATGIVNPQTEAMLNRLYSQLLDRVYVDQSGHRIMVSVAYGDDQADDSVQLHYPEVCYPAQGFQVNSNRIDKIQTTDGDIRVRRLETRYTDTRYEPVTYWTVIGDQQSLGGWDRKFAEIRRGLHGEIVDGLLFRVSSIDRNTADAFTVQDAFIRAVVGAMSPRARLQLAGLP